MSHGEARSGGSAPACAAPLTSMYLDQRGTVRVCCINSTFPLGNVRTDRLIDLWTGETMQQLRKALAEHDYSFGCQLCAPPSGEGLHPTSPARAFDHLLPHAAAWPRQLELALSNTCNLECEMCFGELSSSIRRHREGLDPLPEVYGAEFFEDLEPFLPHLEELRFIGGEPFLSAEAWRLLQRLDRLGIHPRCHVTTNGTVRNRRVDWILDTFPMSFTVSLDGATKETYERIRHGARFEEVVENIDHFAAAAERWGGSMSLAFCLTVDSWRELPAVLEFGEDRGLAVGVNLVTEPARLSLWRSSAEVLAEVSDTWEREADAVAARLDLNRSEWRDNVAWARATAAAAVRDEQAVRIGSRRDPHDLARELAERHAAGGPILEVDIDVEDRILAIRGAEHVVGLGLDLAGTDLQGRPFIALMSGPVVDQFGSAFTSHLEDRHGRRVRFHEMTFPDGRSVQVTTVPASEKSVGRAYLSVGGDEAASPTDAPPGTITGTRVSTGVDRRPVLVDPELDRAFSVDGYTVFPFLDEDGLTRLRQRIEPLVPSDGGPFFSLYRNDTADLRRELDRVVREELEHVLAPMVTGQRAFLGGALVKFPGEGSTLALHQDWSFVDESQAVNASLWVPLEAVDRHNGCLTAVPGSHRLDQPYRGTPPGTLVTDEAAAAMEAGPLTEIPIPRGHAAIYHNALVHGSRANDSDHPRIALILGFISDDADLIHHYLDPGGQRWTYRVRDDFFFDYQPPATPEGPAVLGVEPFSFEQGPVGVEHLADLRTARAVLADPWTQRAPEATPDDAAVGPSSADPACSEDPADLADTGAPGGSDGSEPVVVAPSRRRLWDRLRGR